MKKILTKTKYVPRYEGGSPMGEITKYIRAQLDAYKPTPMHENYGRSQYAAQAGALGANILAIAGQRTEEKPFLPNPTDVNTAFQKVPVDKTMNYLDNFFMGQQNAMSEKLGAAGLSGYDVQNNLAPMLAEQGRTRSGAANDLIHKNADIDRRRGEFNIGIDQGVNQSENMQRTYDNQKLAALGSKFGEGMGAFGNIDTQLKTNQQQLELMNNQRLSNLMSMLFTAGALEKMYK
jgi:hypothetical protein